MPIEKISNRDIDLPNRRINTMHQHPRTGYKPMLSGNAESVSMGVYGARFHHSKPNPTALIKNDTTEAKGATVRTVRG